MGVYKRGGFYWLDYYHAGRRIRESTTVTTKRRAEQLLAKRRAEVFEGRFNIETVKPGPVFEEFTDIYLENYSKPNKAPQSYRRDQTSIKNLRGFFAGKRLSAITPMLIEHYKRKRLKAGKKPATINRELAALKHIFSIAIDWKKVNLNPVKSVKMLREDNVVTNLLSVEGEERLLAEAAPHLRPFLICALDTGMRLGELLGLSWENVDLDLGIIRVVKTKTRRNREIPISGRLDEVLRLLPRSTEHSRVFLGIDGGPIKSLKEAYAAALERAELGKIRFHDLRHTFATRLVLGGVDLFTVKELLGHSTIITTQRYAHPNSRSKRDAIAALSKEPTVVEFETTRKEG
jgi:integrase